MALDTDLDVTVDPEAVSFALHVHNSDDSQATLTFSDSARVEVVVDDGDETVWRSIDGRMFAQVIGTEVIDPGATETYRETWTQPTPGRYTATATLLADECSGDASATFSVD